MTKFPVWSIAQKISRIFFKGLLGWGRFKEQRKEILLTDVAGYRIVAAEPFEWPPSHIGVAMGLLLIPWQQGLGWGDAIQGSKIVPYVAPYWAETTTLAVRSELVRLFSRLGLRVRALAPGDETVTRALVPGDIRLPHFEHMQLPPLWADETVPFNPDPNLFQVGLCWHGSGGGRSAVGLDDDFRCMPAPTLLPLLSVPGVQFTALHFTDHAQALQALPEGREIQSLSDLDVWDFAGTAAVMKRLDLVITIDTSVAHLAGNLGVPTWLMLVSPSHSGWDGGRWACTPPLYATVRQFRQDTPGDWGPVISDVEAELRSVSVEQPAAAR
jgi:hypothetical protein